MDNPIDNEKMRLLLAHYLTQQQNQQATGTPADMTQAQGPSGMQYSPQNSFQQDYAQNSLFMAPFRWLNSGR